MTTDRPTPPTEDRAREDAELGFPPQLADRLRTAMTTAVADVHAPTGLHDEVQTRRRRRRWMIRSGIALAGAAAAVGTTVAVQAVTPPSIVVDTDPADGRVAEQTDPTVVVDQGVTVSNPAFELAADDNGLHLLERGADGEYVDRRTVVTADELQDLLGEGRIDGVWVRPDSTVDDVQAVLEIDTFSFPGEPRLVTIRFSDGGAAASRVTWEGESQLVGSPFEFAAAWSPDGTSFAYNAFVPGEMWTRPGQKEIVVLDVDDDGRPTVAGRAPADPSSFLEWADVRDDGFTLLTEPRNQGRIIATRWVRQPDGSVERLNMGTPD